MDGLSLILGGIFGFLLGLTISTANAKLQAASTKLGRFKKANEEIQKKKEEAKSARDSGVNDQIQGGLFYAASVVIFFAFTWLLFGGVLG